MDSCTFRAGEEGARHRVDGKFLQVKGERFFIKGVTYGTFRPNEEGEPFPPFPQVREDFARMREAGINTVRLYTPPPDRVADAAADAGLYLIPDFCWGPRRCEEIEDPDRLRSVYDWTREHSRRLAGHPAVLLHSIGNEIPPLVVRWFGRERIEGFLRTLHDIVKEQSPDALVTYANHPPSEHLHLPFLDVVAFNVYLEREPEFRAYLARLHSLAGDRPVFLAEMGLDSRANGAEAQARSLDWQLRAVFEKGLCGATVYAWTDEWSIFEESVEGWAFGLTDADRRPKPALETVRRIYGADPYAQRERPWPLVSVVVASYNGGATLEACLASLDRLCYPRYEVIVVDDGSTDDTPEIVAGHAVRSIRTENRGLSNARNLGIEMAGGEIVAFLDSDARADPHWLHHLVLALEEQSAAAVGGPNLCPPEDGFAAQCVDLAPGNPTHVLLTDERAEHVPGCNMAWKKSALSAIGRFDPVHRAAGDDVDVCWKLLVREQVIAFAPSGLVWHHRRPTVSGYLRQQRGYGLAEAHLRRRYPGHFNVWGHLVWAGGIYDGVHAALRREGMPALFRPRVYQGWFGGAPFQSLYQPFAIWWFQIFTTVEWQVIALCVLLSGLLGTASEPVAGAVLLALGVVMAAITLCSADAAAANAVAARGWRGRALSQGIVLVAALHILQPLARALGRLRGAWAARHARFRFPAVRRLWGNLSQRDAWLRRLERDLDACNWVCRPTSPWGEADLDVLGPGPCTLQIRSVHEENLARGEHFVRYRVTARWKPWALLLIGALLLALPTFVRFPFLLPLAVPLGALLARLVLARRATTEAISQLATECAEGLDMPVADEGK